VDVHATGEYDSRPFIGRDGFMRGEAFGGTAARRMWTVLLAAFAGGPGDDGVLGAAAGQR
jgi:hypothetical protein